jgi:hypothetical protein
MVLAQASPQPAGIVDAGCVGHVDCDNGGYWRQAGGGPHHLLPFVPLCLYAIIISVGAPTAESRAGAIMFIFVLLVFGPDYIVNTRYTKSIFLNSQAERDKIAELGTYLKAFPEAQIGVSDDEHYSDTLLQNLFCFGWTSAPR